jgi:hypothetical protein
MSLARVTAWTLLVACGFALTTPTATGQNPLPKKNSEATRLVTYYRDDVPRGGIPKEDLKKVREQFKSFAKYYADVVAHPDVWKWSQDPKVLKLGEVPPPRLEGPDGILHDIDRFLIEPGVTRTNNVEPADYIREVGAAFDAVLKELIETHQEPIVQINAARVLAHVARTGAPAHFTTVTTLLSNANTPTGVKYYLLHAAAALLAAPDVYEPKVRRHAAKAEVIGALVKAVDDCITNPSMIVPGVALDRPETLTTDQLAVVGFVRRQAVRALGQVKFVTVPGPDGKTPLYPAYTLVRIAMSDPALVPAPGPAEAAEAAIGICNMAPMVEQLKGGFKQIKEYNSDVAVEAVMNGLATFAKPRAGNPADNTLPWRRYSARFAEALRNWRPLFDPDFEPSAPTKFDAKLVPPGVEELNRDFVPIILAPMDKVDFAGKADVGARVEIDRLQQRITQMRTRPKRNTLLFAGVPQTTVDFPPPKKELPAPPKEGAKKDDPKKN